ncbi:MAG: type IV pilus secretin PilQ [Acidobacteriota bacterium]
MNKRIRKATGGRLASTAMLALLVLQVGCSSGQREARTEPAANVVAERSPAQIEKLDLNDDGTSASLELQADRPLVWTSFRNPEGDLVVELPNSVPADSVADMTRSGLVTSVSIEKLDDAERPLTRLVVRTSEPSEHSLSGEGDRLRLALLPIDSAQEVTLAYEPIDEPSPVASETLTEPEPVVGETLSEPAPTPVLEPATVSQASIPQTYGTPDAPQLGPPPAGVIASQLYSVDILEADAGTVVQVVGDGEFAFSSFRLENPERFVIDLTGVVNTGASATVPVGSANVEQIRIGQFKPRPEPVSRVVFDLQDGSVPTITRTGDGLLVSFGGAAIPEVAAARVPEMVAPEPEPEPEPVEVLAQSSPPAPSFEAPEPVYEEPEATDVPAPQEVAVWSPPAPSDPAPAAQPSVPVYQPAASLPAPAALGDVAQFEAQSVDVDDQGRTEQERLLESFGSLVVSRQERQYVGEPISMSLKNADLVETLRSFAKISDLNFVIQPGVRGTVTVELKSVPWDQAMEQILKINNLGMDIDGTIVRIAPTTQLRREAEEQRRLSRARQQSIPLRTVMRSLSYAPAQAMANLMRSRQGAILSRRGSVQIDNRTNTLIIRELPDNIDTVLAVIDTLDTPEPQVTIEAKIVEVTKSFSRSLGIDWNYDFESSPRFGNTTGLQFPNNGTTDGGVGLLTGGANGFLNLSLGNILNTFNLNARLQVAENEGLANVVSAPRVTTLNNNAAQIQSGFQIPIQTVSDRTVSVQFVNATLRLAVTPQVTAEGTVILDINLSRRSPQPALAINGAQNVPIATREARTRVIVRDGGTAVIGGIYEVSNDEGQDRVPGLANIPILGHLFKNRNRTTSNDELMLFVTPRIVQL